MLGKKRLIYFFTILFLIGGLPQAGASNYKPLTLSINSQTLLFKSTTKVSDKLNIRILDGDTLLYNENIPRSDLSNIEIKKVCLCTVQVKIAKNKLYESKQFLSQGAPYPLEKPNIIQSESSALLKFTQPGSQISNPYYLSKTELEKFNSFYDIKGYRVNNKDIVLYSIKADVLLVNGKKFNTSSINASLKYIKNKATKFSDLYIDLLHTPLNYKINIYRDKSLFETLSIPINSEEFKYNKIEKGYTYSFTLESSNEFGRELSSESSIIEGYSLSMSLNATSSTSLSISIPAYLAKYLPLNLHLVSLSNPKDIRDLTITSLTGETVIDNLTSIGYTVTLEEANKTHNLNTLTTKINLPALNFQPNNLLLSNLVTGPQLTWIAPESTKFFLPAQYIVEYKKISDTLWSSLSVIPVTSSNQPGALSLNFAPNSENYLLRVVNVTNNIRYISDNIVLNSNLNKSVTNLTAVPGENKVNLAWSPPLSLDGTVPISYKIAYGNTESGNDTLTSSLSNAITITSLTYSQSYHFTVTPIYSIGEGDPLTILASPLQNINLPLVSNTDISVVNQSPLISSLNGTTKSPSTASSSVQNFTSSPENSSLILSWQRPSYTGDSPITAYNIYYKKTNETNYNTITYTGVPTTYTLTGLTNGATYNIKISALNSAGSGTESVLTAIPSDQPSAPTNLVVTGGSNNQLTVSFTAPTNTGGTPVLEYKIYYKLASDTNFQNFLSTSSLNNTITLLNDGLLYDVKVVPYNIAGEGTSITSYNNLVTGLPSPVTNLSVNLSSSPTVYLAWSAPINSGGSNIINYKIRYREVGTLSYLYMDANTLDANSNIITSKVLFSGFSIGSNYEISVASENANGLSTYTSSFLINTGYQNTITASNFVITQQPILDSVVVSPNPGGQTARVNFTFTLSGNIYNSPVNFLAVYYQLSGAVGSTRVNPPSLDINQYNGFFSETVFLAPGNYTDVTFIAFNSAGPSIIIHTGAISIT